MIKRIKKFLCNAVTSSKPEPASRKATSQELYEQFTNHLVLREGIKYEVYKDSLGKLTAGVGHLLPNDTELDEGSPVSVEQVMMWLYEDAKEAWDAAREQLLYLPACRNEDSLLLALASVNFQLGTKWFNIHRKTWAHLQQGAWALAAKEAQNSLWYKQTPVRVKDFQTALKEQV